MRRAHTAILCGVALAVCSAADARPPQGTRVAKRTPATGKMTRGGAATRAASIRRFANRWQGTSYRWGGNTRSGIDCSGYSRQMFRDLFNIELPRTTRTQIKLGVDIAVRPGALGTGFEPGDLFFYVDPAGIPNHVVVYMGDGQFTHSASGRGVVVDGFKALWGRRIVGRRMLVPARGGGGGYGPIPAAGPIVAQAVPCPPSIRARPEETRRFRIEPLGDFKALPARDLCDWRALAKDLRRRGGRHAESNAVQLDEYVVWLQSIDNFKDEIGGGLR